MVPQKRSLEADDEGEGNEDDWEELAREERMAKKVKKREITQLEFDAEFTSSGPLLLYHHEFDVCLQGHCLRLV